MTKNRDKVKKNESTHLDILCLAFSMDSHVDQSVKYRSFKEITVLNVIAQREYMCSVAHRILDRSYSEYI